MTNPVQPTIQQNYVIGADGQPTNTQQNNPIPPGPPTIFTSELPFVQANVYAAGDINAHIVVVAGTLPGAGKLGPINSSVAPVIFQTVNNLTAGAGITAYASLIKTTTSPIDHHCIFSEAVDNAGGAGSSISAGRFSSSLLVGTGGNGVGCVNLATAAVTYKYLAGEENQVFQNTGTDAGTAYTAAKFACAGLASSPGTGSNRADAGWMTNPNSPGTSGKGFVTGFLVATNLRGAGLDTVWDTAFRNDASLVNGLDLTRGTYSGYAITANGMTVDNSGNTVVASLSSTNFMLSNGNVTGSFFGIGGAAVAATTALAIGAGTTGHSQINFATSTAPATPNNGDWWFDGTNLNIVISNSTKTISHS